MSNVHIKFKEGSELLRIHAFSNGAIVTFFKTEVGGKLKVQWFMHHKGDWLGDYSLVTDGNVEAAVARIVERAEETSNKLFDAD